MKKFMLTLSLLLALLLTVAAVLAQDQIIEPTGETVNPNVNIIWPPPVYTLRGLIDIRGTANAAGMANFFIEFRPLNFDEVLDGTQTPQQRPWFPATLPTNQPIIDGILGSWNTSTTPDGLYELRLTVNVNGAAPQIFRVSPLRIENEPPPFLELGADDMPDVFDQLGIATPDFSAIVTPTLASGGLIRPTLPATPTTASTTPMVTALTDANVRTGDDTRYDPVGVLLTGQSASVIGISSLGSGWYYIALPNGRRGFIAPSVVRLEGDVRQIQLIQPPPPPATPTPVATATPPTSANLRFISLRLDPSPPTCDETFIVYATVENNGTGATNSSGEIFVSDRHNDSGNITETTIGGFPVLAPGQRFEARIPITVRTYKDERHTITVTLDSRNQINETNEGDNINAVEFTLQTGGC